MSFQELTTKNNYLMPPNSNNRLVSNVNRNATASPTESTTSKVSTKTNNSKRTISRQESKSSLRSNTSSIVSRKKSTKGATSKPLNKMAPPSNGSPNQEALKNEKNAASADDNKASKQSRKNGVAGDSQKNTAEGDLIWKRPYCKDIQIVFCTFQTMANWVKIFIGFVMLSNKWHAFYPNLLWVLFFIDIMLT